jgi:hypothetical protein
MADAMRRMEARMQAQDAKLLVLSQERRDAILQSRKDKIALEIAKYPGKSLKRTLKHNLECLDLIDDLDNVFKALAIDAEDGVIATPDNIDDVNKAVEELTAAVEALRKHVRHESDMQIVSATSPLGWGTVDQLEIALKDNNALTVSAAEIHAAEKAKMSFDKEVRAAKAAAAGSYTGGKARAVREAPESASAGDAMRFRPSLSSQVTPNVPGSAGPGAGAAPVRAEAAGVGRPGPPPVPPPAATCAAGRTMPTLARRRKRRSARAFLLHLHPFLCL